jgi:hypothetical protein
MNLYLDEYQEIDNKVKLLWIEILMWIVWKFVLYFCDVCTGFYGFFSSNQFPDN